jgi:type II secretory pathway pseudopilin PulG
MGTHGGKQRDRRSQPRWHRSSSNNLTRPPLSNSNYRLRPLSSLIGRRPQLLPIAKGGSRARGTRRGLPLRAARPFRIPHSEFHISRSGYTLVEILVATGLALLMLTLFLTIFQMATQAMTIQKGMSANDQKARLVQMILRNDLNGDKFDSADPCRPRACRTFRNVLPFGAGENGMPHFDATDRCGYFYISENDPNNDTDDVLQFTVMTPDTDADRFHGRVGPVLPNAQGKYGLVGGVLNLAGSLLNPLLPGTLPPPGDYWPNQPEFDDVLGTPNGTGSSTLAEVAWFLRNGDLYRRVMLIRKPNVASPPDDHSPLDLLGNVLSLELYEPGGTRNFFTDYDYSAFHDGSGIRFHGRSSLTWCNSVFSLTNPAFRFGFDSTSNPGSGFGIPREHVGKNFIGRFTHGETSHPKFNFPGRIGTGFLNPLSAATPLSVENGTVATLANGPRAGEDLLVSNVHSFDIKVWDPAASPGPDGRPGRPNFDDDGINGVDDPGELGAPGSDDGAFRDLGHRGTTGHYKYLPAASRPNNYYSNSDMGHNRYDSWSPNIDLDGDLQHDHPPYRPVWVGPDLRPGKAHFDDDGCNGVDDAGELGWPGTDDFAPLTAIQIKVRFYDEVSNQVREVTTVLSLAYSP